MSSSPFWDDFSEASKLAPMTTDANAQPQNRGVTTPSENAAWADTVSSAPLPAGSAYLDTAASVLGADPDSVHQRLNQGESAQDVFREDAPGLVAKNLAGMAAGEMLGGAMPAIARQLTPAAMASDAVLDAHPAFNSDGVLPDISHTPIGRMNRDIGMGVPGAAEVKTYHDPVSGEVHMGVTGPDGKGLAATTDVETPTGRHLHDLHIASGLKGGTVAADLQAARLAAIAQTHPNATITAGTGSPLSDALKDSIDATVLPDGTVVGTAKPQGGYGIPENPDPRALPGAYGTPGSGDLLPIEPPGVVPGPGSAGVEPSGVKMHDVGPRAHPANPIAPGPDNEPTKGK